MHKKGEVEIVLIELAYVSCDHSFTMKIISSYCQFFLNPDFFSLALQNSHIRTSFSYMLHTGYIVL